MNHKVVEGKENELSKKRQSTISIANQGKSSDKNHKGIGEKAKKGRIDAKKTDRGITDKEIIDPWNTSDRERLNFDNQHANRHDR